MVSLRRKIATFTLECEDDNEFDFESSVHARARRTFSPAKPKAHAQHGKLVFVVVVVLQSEGRYFSSERGDSRKHVCLRKLSFIHWYIFSVVGIVNLSAHISKPEKCEFCLIYFSPYLLFPFQNVREASTLQLRHYYKVRKLLRTLCDLVD